MRITSKGQVTIPVNIRQRLGLVPGTDVDFVVDNDGVRIVRHPVPARDGRGARAVRRLRATGSIRMSTDEILALTRKT